MTASMHILGDRSRRNFEPKPRELRLDPALTQSGFSMVMRRIRARSSGAIGRRPGFPLRLERRRQYVRHP
jgi:hypothetical protein